MVDVALKHLTHWNVWLVYRNIKHLKKHLKLTLMSYGIIQIELLYIAYNKGDVFKYSLHYSSFFCDVFLYYLV